MSNSQKTGTSKDKPEPTNPIQLRGQAYIGLGKEAKKEVFYNLSSEGSIEYNVLPSEKGQIPQLNTPTENKDTSSQQGAAAPIFQFVEDPLEPGEIRITAHKVHRQNIPYLDLQEQHITSLADLQAAFHNLALCRCSDEPPHKPHGRKDTR